MKGRAEPIVMVTAYDFSTAQVAEQAGVDLVLVGDSAAMVVLGLRNDTARDDRGNADADARRAARRAHRHSSSATCRSRVTRALMISPSPRRAASSMLAAMP